MISMLTMSLSGILTIGLIIAVIADIIKGKFRYSKRVLIVFVIVFVGSFILNFISKFMGWNY